MIKAGINMPTLGQKGRVVNGVEGMKQPGNKLPSQKSGGPGNAAGFRSTAAKSMMR